VHVALVELGIDLLGSRELGVELKLAQQAACAQQAEAVGRSVVSQANAQAVAGKLVGVGCGVADVTLSWRT